MSENGGQITSGSSGTGLTFVRPLPKAPGAPAEGDQSSSIRKSSTLSLTDRLFPPKNLEESSALPPVTGVELGHFVMEERIGRGGMGAVFRAIDTRLDRVVALKVLSPDMSSDPEAVQRFQNEARAAARLDHDNIARVHYYGQEHGLYFIAFEFVSGTNVRDFIVKRGRLSPQDAVNYTLQIAEALRHTSAAGVVHRDIKPSNIIISPTGRAKLVDLGLARHADPEASKDLTIAGTALGTFDYIAPEQAIDARNVDVRSDIYSLGCTLYHMLTGSPPYPTGTMFEKVMNHHRPTPPDPAEINPLVSPQLAQIVRKMMAANPNERYASPDHLIADLLGIARQLGLEPMQPETLAWTAAPRTRRGPDWYGMRTWVAVALFLVLLVFLDRLRWDGTRAVTGWQTPAPSPIEENPSNPARTQQPTRDNAEPQVNGVVSAIPTPTPQQTAGPSTSIPPAPGEAPTATVASPTDSITAAAQAASPVETQKGSDVPRVVDSLPDPQSLLDTFRSSTRVGLDRLIPKPQPDSASSMRTDPFVVIPQGSGERMRRSNLASACLAAPDNSVIEIQANGLIILSPETINITGKRVRIRADQYSRPVLRFDLSRQSSGGTLSRTASIFKVDRGALDLFDLDIEMIADTEAATDWSMVTLANGSQLTAHGVSFTMVNPGQAATSLVHIPEGEAQELGELMTDRSDGERTTKVDMMDCICRGEFDFAFQRRLGIVEYALEHVAFAITGTLLRVDGSDAFMMAMEPISQNTTTFMMDHVTAYANQGLLRATSGDYGTLPRVNMAIRDSVFRVDPPNQPFVEIYGHEDLELLRDRLQIQENRDPSFYKLSGPLCVIESTVTTLPKPVELTPEQFGISPLDLVETNLLQLPESVSPRQLHRLQPSSMQLDRTDDNPAVVAASDLQDAGVNWNNQRLPLTLPVPGTADGSN